MLYVTLIISALKKTNKKKHQIPPGTFRQLQSKFNNKKVKELQANTKKKIN